MFTSSPVDLELNRDFNGEDYEYEDEAKLVIFPDHFEIPLPNIEELPALVSESVLHGALCVSMHAAWEGALSGSPITEQTGRSFGLNPFIRLGLSESFMATNFGNFALKNMIYFVEAQSFPPCFT